MSDWSEIADAVREYETRLRATPFPAGPTALPSQLATNPNPATGPAPTNVATATSPANYRLTPGAGVLSSIGDAP